MKTALFLPILTAFCGLGVGWMIWDTSPSVVVDNVPDTVWKNAVIRSTPAPPRKVIQRDTRVRHRTFLGLRRNFEGLGKKGVDPSTALTWLTKASPGANSLAAAAGKEILAAWQAANPTDA